MTKEPRMVDKLSGLIYSKPVFAFLFVFVMLFLVYFNQKRGLKRIQKWQNSLNLPKHALVFQQLYQRTDGFLLSRQARKKQDAIEYVYGEIEFLPFIALLSLAQLDGDTVFYDLGSGIGKAVLACAMVYPVQESVGIELLPELYQEACKQTQQLKKMQNYSNKAKKIKFIHGNFLEVDLTNATLIFINSTTMIGSLWEDLCTRLNDLPQLNTVITASKPLLSDYFLIVKRTKIQMSWGIVEAYIHTRKTNFH
jgi:hypothetical protein